MVIRPGNFSASVWGITFGLCVYRRLACIFRMLAALRVTARRSDWRVESAAAVQSNLCLARSTSANRRYMSLKACRMVARASTGPRLSASQRLKMIASVRFVGCGMSIDARKRKIASQKGRFFKQHLVSFYCDRNGVRNP